jgi:hypothetical protein
MYISVYMYVCSGERVPLGRVLKSLRPSKISYTKAVYNDC